MVPGDPSRRSAVLLILAAITAWGVYFPFAKLVLRSTSPVTFLILRLGIGAATLAALNLHLRRSLRIDRRDWLAVVVSGLIGIVLHQLIQLNGLTRTSATNTGWILTLIPPVTTLLAWFWLKERIRWQTLAGLVIAMLGVLLLVSGGDVARISVMQNRGDLLALLSVLTWSVATVLMKEPLSRCEPIAMSLLHMALGFVFFLLVGAGGFSQEIATMRSRDWIITILIGLMPSGLAYYWFSAGLKQLRATDTTMFLFIEAIVASLTGWVVLGESFTGPMLIGAIVIVFGVWFSQRRSAMRKELAIE